MKTVVIVALLALFEVLTGPPRSGAQDLEPEKGVFFTGNDMHLWCQSNRAMALAYTAGAWDTSARTWIVLDNLMPRGRSGAIDKESMVAATVNLGKELLVGYCEPPRVTVDQVTDVFCAYLRDAPEERNVHAALLFNTAMKKAWPCKNSLH
jgi:hypothetical protein